MNQADTAWMLISTALVLLMTPALAFFYGGLVRSKNALNTMMMSFISLGFVGALWGVIGYSLAFSAGNNYLGDLSRLFLNGVGLEAQGTIPHYLFMAYQGTFCIITAALISGAIVERMRFSAYLLFIACWTLLVYAPVCHWVWGGGWLQQLGALDFAGDSGYGPHFSEIAKRLGPFDLALLPIGAYAPRWFMRPVHMDPDEAICAHADLGSPATLAMHWGTFQLTDEPIDEPVRRLGQACASAGVAPDRFRVLEHGETVVDSPERREP